MKSFLVLCVALVAFETASAQVIRSMPSIIGGINNCGCGCPSSIIPSCPSSIIAPAIPSCSSPFMPALPVVPQNSVAASLADTLSLLTVSSLLAETLPMGPYVASPCGCGLGGYGGYYY